MIKRLENNQTEPVPTLSEALKKSFPTVEEVEAELGKDPAWKTGEETGDAEGSVESESGHQAD
jgi:hypothetical protein